MTASRYEVSNRTQPSATYLSRDEIESLVTLGDDTVRVMQHLPGVATNESRPAPTFAAAHRMSSPCSSTGCGSSSPPFTRLPGCIQRRRSARRRERRRACRWIPGGYGNALSALLLIEPREPTELAHEIGFSALYTSALTSGTFADGQRLVAGGEQCNLDRVLADQLGEPAYSDVFVRVGVDVGSEAPARRSAACVFATTSS